MELYDVVEVLVDLQDEGIPAGAIGTVILVFDGPSRTYEVEFADRSGRTVATAALTDDQLGLRQ